VKALQQALHISGLESLGLDGMLITDGAKGGAYQDFSADQVFEVAGISVIPVDTTGVDDTFCSYFIRRFSLGEDPQTALTCANRAAALKVTQLGTTDAIPSLQEVMEFAP
jgi:ribokinase